MSVHPSATFDSLFGADSIGPSQRRIFPLDCDNQFFFTCLGNYHYVSIYTAQILAGSPQFAQTLPHAWEYSGILGNLGAYNSSSIANLQPNTFAPLKPLFCLPLPKQLRAKRNWQA